MLFSVALLTVIGSAVAAPTLPEEFTKDGGGGVAQQAIHVDLSKDGVMEFQVANFLANLETAYFKHGAEKAKGWPDKNINGVHPKDELKRIWSEEEAYVETIAETLKYNKAPVVEPCKYNWPDKDDKSFMALASIISNIGIGALINAENWLAKSDPAAIPHLSRILPVKARHDSYFRMYAGETPNPAAYETTLPTEWAYNMALDFVEPGSCHNPPAYFKDIKVYPDLRLDGHGDASGEIPDSPGAFHFTIGQPNLMPPGWENERLWIGWANGDNEIKYSLVTKDGDKLKADLPAGLYGIVYAVLTDQKNIKTAVDLVPRTLAGPLPLPLGPGK